MTDQKPKQNAPHPFKAEAVALWDEYPEPKPTLYEFVGILQERLGVTIKRPTLYDWRRAGHLKGTIRGQKAADPMDVRESRRSPEQQTQALAKQCDESPAFAAAIPYEYDREAVKRTAAKAINMAGEFMDKLAVSVKQVDINTPAGIAAVANSAAMMLDKVKVISDGLRLLDYADNAPVTRPTATVEDFEKALMERTKARGVA